jgi:hypothetical protein
MLNPNVSHEKRLQKYMGFVLLLTVLCGAAFLGAGHAAREGKVYLKKFPVKPGTVLKIYNAKDGDIEVSGWGRHYIEIEARRGCFLKNPKLDVSTGPELIVRTLNSMNLRIAVPQKTLVGEVETSSGKVNLKNLSGSVAVKIATGDTVIRGVKGSVKAGVNMGKINVENVTGDVDAKTSSGDIKIQGVNGFVKAETNMGKINITGVSGLAGARTNMGEIAVEIPAIRDNLEIYTKSGNITAFLSPSLTAQLEANTSKGTVAYSKELPLTVNQLSERRLSGRLGEGGAKIIKIKIKSFGAIILKKLR